MFRAENRDDILFVTSEQTGFGYFKNFGKTRRRGSSSVRRASVGRVTLGAGYTFLRATFESEETVNGESNSTNDAAEDGEPGLEGAIEIEPGDRLPFIPQHLLKIVRATSQVTSRLSVDLDLVASGGSYARGNENNLHEPDGTYYLGEGAVDGYAIVNLGARYRADPAAAADRAGQQPVRSRVRDRRAAGPRWLHRSRNVRGAAACRPSMASSRCGRRRFSPRERPCAPGSARARF